MIKSTRTYRHGRALIGVAMCALLPACNHRSGFGIPAARIASNGAETQSNAPAETTPGSDNPGSKDPGSKDPGSKDPGGNDPGGKDPNDGPEPKPALALVDPVTGLLGKTLVAGGETVKGLTGVTPIGGPLDHVVSKVGDKVIDLGASLRGDGVTGLPLVGGTLQNVSNTLDSTATVSVLNQAIGGTSPLLGVGVLSPSLIDGSLATVGLLSDGTLATASLTPGGAAGLVPAVLGGATSGVLGSASPVLSPVSSLVGVTALNQQLGGATPVIGVSALSASPAQGSLASIDALAGGSIANVSLTGNPVSVLSSPVTPVVGAVAPVVGAVSGVVGAVTPNVVNVGGVAGGGVSLGGLHLGGAAGGGASIPILGGLLGH